MATPRTMNAATVADLDAIVNKPDLPLAVEARDQAAWIARRVAGAIGSWQYQGGAYQATLIRLEWWLRGRMAPTLGRDDAIRWDEIAALILTPAFYREAIAVLNPIVQEPEP